MRCLLTKNIWWLNDPSILLAFWHPDKTFMGEWKVDRLSIESIIIASTNSSIPASITHNQQKNDDCDHTSFPDRIINKVILAHTSLPPPHHLSHITKLLFSLHLSLSLHLLLSITVSGLSDSSPLLSLFGWSFCFISLFCLLICLTD